MGLLFREYSINEIYKYILLYMYCGGACECSPTMHILRNSVRLGIKSRWTKNSSVEHYLMLVKYIL